MLMTTPQSFLTTIEGFETSYKPWSKKTLCDFKTFTQFFTPNQRYNISVMQKNTSPEEVEFFLKNGYYNWSENTRLWFLDTISKNKILRVNPQHAMNESMQIYPENAIRQKLYWNTPEGKFVLFGADNIVGNDDNDDNDNYTQEIKPQISLKCSPSGNLLMTTKNYETGDILTKPIKDYQILPNLINGFRFIGNDSSTGCNPCLGNKECNFSVDVGS